VPLPVLRPSNLAVNLTVNEKRRIAAEEEQFA